MDNERPIEKLLRRYAKKRGEETTPPELHPASRRVLQGEVTRKFGKASGGVAKSFWQQWRWRLVSVSCLIAILAIGVTVFRPSSPASRSGEDFAGLSVSRADGESELREKAAPAAPTAIPAATPPASVAATVAPTHGAELAMAKQAASEPALGGKPAEVSGNVSVFSSDSFSKDLGSLANNNTAQFANAPAPQKYSLADKATPAVLERFRMEQDGDTLRVVDNDGSSYSGTFRQASLQREAPPQLGVKLKSREVDAISDSPENFFFKVSGTNLTLKKTVVFTGRVTTATNSVLNMVPMETRPGNASNQMGFPLLLNSTINGTARIGDAKEVEVNASPVAP